MITTNRKKGVDPKIIIQIIGIVIKLMFKAIKEYRKKEEIRVKR